MAGRLSVMEMLGNREWPESRVLTVLYDRSGASRFRMPAFPSIKTEKGLSRSLTAFESRRETEPVS